VDVIALSTEGAEVEIVIFHGEEAFYWTSMGISNLVFVLEGYHFNIFGQIDKAVIVQIAENLKIS